MRKIFNNFCIIGCLALTGLFSCKKDENLPAQKPLSPCQLISSSTSDPFGKIDSTHFFYDNLGRVVEYEDVNTLERYKIIYNQAGRIEKILDRYGYDFERRFYNSSGQLYKITHTRGWTVDSIDRKTFQYDASGKIISAWWKKFGMFGAVNNHFTKYFYNSKGLLVLDSTFYVDNGQHSFFWRNAFEYENQPRVGARDFKGWYDESLYLFAPLTHNIVSRDYERKIVGGDIKENYTLNYEYNALGYPTKIDIHYNGYSWITKKLWYECL